MNHLFLSFIILAALVSCKTADGRFTGAYDKLTKVTTEEVALFHKAVDAKMALTPKKVSRQVVAGTNYEFICKDTEGKKHTVVIFQPLPGQGEPRVTSVDGKEVK